MSKITRADVSWFRSRRSPRPDGLRASTQTRSTERIDGMTVGIQTVTKDAPYDGEVHPDGDEILYVISAQDPAHRVDGEGHLPRGDEGESHSLSFAKNVAAAFKMPRSTTDHFAKPIDLQALVQAVEMAPGP
jgi:hypothetical protein